MSIPNKQIGWSNESNLLWQIAKQLERLTGVTSKISGGGGSSATVVTKAQVDALIASNSLVPGSTYIITGVDVPLYGGTTIMLQAETTNKLTLAGHGVFYNPKYQNSQLTPNNGYGIWYNYFGVSLSSVVGTFYNGQTVTANNGATATYVTSNLFRFISGNWATATSINNGSGATANISGAVSPSYAIGQDVIWGGKHWTNKTGNVGTAIDIYTLDSTNWEVVPFNSTDYNVEIDVIHYDYLHDTIIRRKDKWNNDVNSNYGWCWGAIQDYDGSPIKAFQWGNGPDDGPDQYGGFQFIGVFSNYVNNSYLECINFVGNTIYNNEFNEFSKIYSNVIAKGSGSINYNKFWDSDIINNYLVGGNIVNNSSHASDILSNTISYSSISSNHLRSGSKIFQNNLTNSYISSNELQTGYIQYNTLTSYAEISYNVLSNASKTSVGVAIISTIENNSLNNYANIYGCTLRHSVFDFSSSGTITAKYIKFIEANYANAVFNISTATIIFNQTYSKQMFRNSAGTTRLGYYNASDVFTVVNVNA